MKTLFLALLLCCHAAFAVAPPSFVECAAIGIAARAPSGGTNITGYNTYTGTGLPEDQWNYVDIRTNPALATVAGIKGVFITGILIITNPDTAASADMHVAFRAPGDSVFSCADYNAQATLTGYGGTREPIGFWVPVINNLIEVCWRRITSGGLLGANTYYGAAIAVNAYCR